MIIGVIISSICSGLGSSCFSCSNNESLILQSFSAKKKLIVSLSGLTSFISPLISWFASFILIALIAIYVIKEKGSSLDVITNNNYLLSFVLVFFYLH